MPPGGASPPPQQPPGPPAGTQPRQPPLPNRPPLGLTSVRLRGGGSPRASLGVVTTAETARLAANARCERVRPDPAPAKHVIGCPRVLCASATADARPCARHGACSPSTLPGGAPTLSFSRRAEARREADLRVRVWDADWTREAASEVGNAAAGKGAQARRRTCSAVVKEYSAAARFLGEAEVRACEALLSGAHARQGRQCELAFPSAGVLGWEPPLAPLVGAFEAPARGRWYGATDDIDADAEANSLWLVYNERASALHAPPVTLLEAARASREALAALQERRTAARGERPASEARDGPRSALARARDGLAEDAARRRCADWVSLGCGALAWAHARGVAHGALGPESLLYSSPADAACAARAATASDPHAGPCAPPGRLELTNLGFASVGGGDAEHSEALAADSRRLGAALAQCVVEALLLPPGPFLPNGRRRTDDDPDEELEIIAEATRALLGDGVTVPDPDVQAFESFAASRPRWTRARAFLDAGGSRSGWRAIELLACARAPPATVARGAAVELRAYHYANSAVDAVDQGGDRARDDPVDAGGDGAADGDGGGTTLGGGLRLPPPLLAALDALALGT